MNKPLTLMMAVCLHANVQSSEPKMHKIKTWGHVAHYKFPGKVVVFRYNRMQEEIKSTQEFLEKFTLKEQKKIGLNNELQDLQTVAQNDIHGLLLNKQGCGYGYVHAKLLDLGYDNAYAYAFDKAFLAQSNKDTQKNFHLSDKNLRLFGITMRLVTQKEREMLKDLLDKKEIIFGGPRANNAVIERILQK